MPKPSYSKTNNNPKRTAYAFDTADERKARNKDQNSILDIQWKQMFANCRTVSVSELHARTKIFDVSFETAKEYFEQNIVQQIAEKRCREIPSLDDPLFAVI